MKGTQYSVGRDENHVDAILKIQFDALGFLYSVGKVISTHRHTIHKSLSHILLSFILDVAKVMKKNEVHKFVNHKLVNFVFIYDFQAIKIQLFHRNTCKLGKESVSLPNYSNL